ncbi:MAG: class I SAM-dependent methyltransferase [Cyclobacteriaceae bacterium]|nr:class I SAM-dependent methyltransferase [Cyclobacteriaceae bacterium]
MELYKHKADAYFSNIRFDLISLLPKRGVGRLLELGAGSCDTLVEIKRQNLAEVVVGVELMRLPGTNQENALIDELFYGDFETLNKQFQANSFDVVICGDVLEHLIDPWTAVQNLNYLLKPGGLFIISCPNIRYYETFVNIYVKGSFGYTDFGLFDRTHLRFFCRRDLVQMLRGAGLTVKSVIPSFKFHRKSKFFILNAITFGLFEQLLAVQYVIRSERKT